MFGTAPVLAQTEDLDVTAEGANQLGSLSGWSLDFLQRSGLELLANAVVAAVILLIGRFVASIIVRVMRRMLDRAAIDQMLVRFLTNLVYALLLLVVVLAALEQLGVQTTSLTAVLAAAGFAIGMALQGSLGNFAAGMMLILFRPFKVGDSIEAGGTSGIVEELQIFNTILRTPDNRQVVVPNGQITASTIVNNAARQTRRIDLEIGCGYGDDLLAVKSFLNELIDEDPRILDDPEPVVAVNQLAESSVNFVVRPWVAADDFFAVRSDLLEHIKLGFDQRGFSFPFPSRDVYMHPASPAT